MVVELLLPYHRPADVSSTFVLHPLPFWGLTSTYKRDTVYIIFTRSHYNCINTPTTTTHYKYVFTHYRKTDDEKADCIGQPSYFCGGCFWILLGRKQWSKGPTMGMTTAVSTWWQKVVLCMLKPNRPQMKIIIDDTVRYKYDYTYISSLISQSRAS